MLYLIQLLYMSIMGYCVKHCRFLFILALIWSAYQHTLENHAYVLNNFIISPGLSPASPHSDSKRANSSPVTLRPTLQGGPESGCLV